MVERDGAALIEAIFSRLETTALLQEIADHHPARSRAGIRHALRHSAVRCVAYDSRLMDIAAAILSAAARPFRATLFDKSQAANWLVVWHQDTALPLQSRRDVDGWGPWSIKEGIEYAHAPTAALSQVLALRISLDDSNAENGPLRVIP